MDLPIWVTVLVAIGSMIGGGFGQTLIGFLTKKGEDTRANSEQALKMYQTLIIEIRSEMKELTDNMEVLRAEHLKCEKENARLNIKIDLLVSFLPPEMAIKIKESEAKLKEFSLKSG